MIPNSIEEAKGMNYSQLVWLLGERNRPSGWIRTVHSVAVNAIVRPWTRMLEIWSNTWFTCVNMALLTWCECVGIDVTETSIAEAKDYANENGMAERVTFVMADALNIPFDDQTFDFVWCSNVTSFIKDKDRAISEYLRVLKEGGTLIVAPIYYRKSPPGDLLDKVSEAVWTRIEAWSKDYWQDLFFSIAEKKGGHLVKYYEKDYAYVNRDADIEEYSSGIFKNSRILSDLGSDIRQAIVDRYVGFMKIFNENLQFAGFSIFLFQKRRTSEQVELFITTES